MIDKELHNKLALTCEMLTACTEDLWRSGHDTYARQVKTALSVMERVRDGVEKVLTNNEKT